MRNLRCLTIMAAATCALAAGSSYGSPSLMHVSDRGNDGLPDPNTMGAGGGHTGHVSDTSRNSIPTMTNGSGFTGAGSGNDTQPLAGSTDSIVGDGGENGSRTDINDKVGDGGTASAGDPSGAS